MAEPLTPEEFAEAMDRHRERQLAGPTHCGPMCEPDILRLAARAAAPSPTVEYERGRRDGLAEAREAMEWALREVAAGTLTNTDLLTALATVDALRDWIEDTRRG